MEKSLNIKIPLQLAMIVEKLILKRVVFWIVMILCLLSIISFYNYYQNGMALAYNDARSHLNIGRRVVEGLKPGFAQIGSVWLPLNHALMIPFIWNDFLWHTGLSGALWSMLSFVLCGVLIYKLLEKLEAGIFARVVAVLTYIANINILYLQSTAMTESLLLATMMAGVYYLVVWAKEEKLVDLVKSAFWIMAATLVRYDGWFLLLFSALLIAVYTFKKTANSTKNFANAYKNTEGLIILFLTLGALGIALWVLWNLLIFNDPLYFIFGPFSAHTQQEQLEAAGNLATKGNFLFSVKTYFLALFYNSYTIPSVFGFIGALILTFDKKIKASVRIMSLALLAPLIFNILALTFGFSVLFIQGLQGNSWFNVRYGIMMAPAFAIYVGYLAQKASSLKWVITGLIALVTFFAFANKDAVTIEDALYGSSGKNVTEVSGWLNENAKDPGFVLISAASHDAIIFSSQLPMKKFIHEGTGKYWEGATENPAKLARWIIMRTNDPNDLAWNKLDKSSLHKYDRKESFPFADIYELKEEYLNTLVTDQIYPNQK